MKKVLLTAMMAFGILVAGCDKGSGYRGESTPGSLEITINSTISGTRLMGDPEPDQYLENTVHNFLVFVFSDATGVLEKTAIVNTGLSTVINDLDASSAKKVTVLVNCPSDFIAQIGDYSDFADKVINVDSQIPGDFSQYGLFMSGESDSPIRLDPATTVSATVEVRRVAAKVRLGTLTIDAPLTGFEITGVSMQKVPMYAYMLGGDVAVDGQDGDYAGGLPGDISTVLPPLQNTLSQNYSLPNGYVSGAKIEPHIYFYVLPNNDDYGRATSLVIAGKYNGVEQYYVFVINDKVADDGISTTDGTFIERNKVYTLNVTLKNLGSGADNPDNVRLPAPLEVVIKVTDWEGFLIQNVEW